MKHKDIIAAVDIGTAKIVAALAEISLDGEINVLTYAETASKGVKKGGVANIGMVQHALDNVLDELQGDGSYHIHSVIASLSGVSVMGHNADGVIPVKGTPITEHNVKQAVAIAKDVAMIDGRQLLHILRQDFIVDRQTDIENPIGLMGEQLCVRAHVISAARTAYYNLLQTFSHRDIDVEYVVASGLASALAVTNSDEKQLGVCVIDIGSGTTDVTVIQNKTVKHTEVVQIGGELITSDIAFFMRSTIENAEDIKKQIDISKDYADDDTVSISGLGHVARSYHKRDIANVARERCEQLISVVMEKLYRAGVEDYFPGGIVICGGSAHLHGLDALFMQHTQMPVRIANIEFPLVEKAGTHASYATLMGLFCCANADDYTRVMTKDAKTGIITQLRSILRTCGGKLRSLF